MFNYNGHTCDVCNEKFNPQSDVVVCPECGTPHHRECYKQLGHCVNEAKHAEGFEWKAPERVVNPNANVCPKCASENPKDATFCENCGIALAPQNAKGYSAPQPPPVGDFMGQNKTNAVPPVFPKTLEGEAEGVSYKDMAVYMGPSYAYYIYNFKRLAADKKAKTFCWSAFFFDGLYFMYRKMWLEAIIILLVSSILAIPSTIVLAQTAGLIEVGSPLLFSGIETVVTVCSILTFAVKVMLGFIAVPRYQKKVIRDLKHIKAQSTSSNDYYQTIAAKSGPSKAILFVSIAFFIIYLFI